jgi:putative ABC transport system permease protein
MRVDTGIEPGEKLVVALILPIAKYPEVRDQVDFFSGLMESLRTLPGVRAVESTTSLPLNQSAGRTQDVFVEGRPIPPPGEVPAGPHQRFVTEGYFRTMSIPLLRGRIFDDSDSKTLVLLVNETMAEKIWPGQDPIGQRLSFEPGGRLREVIGIVGDTKDRRLDAPAKAAMYAPHPQREWAPISWAFLVIETFGEPTALASAVRTTVNEADPALDIYRISTMREEVSEMFSERRFGILVLGLFAASALLLASVGVFSVLYYEVSQRRREIGVRMALGATARDIWRLFMSHGMRSVLVGLALGCLVSLVLTRFIESMLFEVSAADPAAYAAVALLLSLAALTACYLPAKRAARVTPAESIRQE